MSEIEIILPKMGESVAEATITKWLKSEGDTIEAEESLVEIATDKVDSEVPAVTGGVLSKILVKEGEVAQVGQAIAIISSQSVSKESVSAASSKESNNATVSTSENSKKEEKQQQVETTPPISFQSGTKFYSPLVKTIAKKEGVTLQELEEIDGTGQNGRVTKKDILDFLPTREKNIKISKDTVVTKSENKPIIPPARSFNGAVEIIEMDRMRKLISDHMVMSKRVSPHVTSFVEADVTNMVLWREKVKNKFEQREGEKITFTPLFVEIVAKALKDFPLVNVSVDGNTIIRKKYINIGIATALPSGNLIVPVIKDADRMNLTGLAKSVNSLVTKARNNKLSPDEIQDGTFTITNVGTFGNLSGTPIINQPQVAILATGAIKKKPAVIETPSGDFIGIRHMMYLSLSYDHRVVDGALGGSFLRKIADYMEQFELDREL